MSEVEVQERNWFRLGYLIHDVSRMRQTAFDQAMKPAGLTRSQWWVLANLVRQDAGPDINSSDLAKMLDIGKVTLGGIIDRLEATGLVERLPDAHDRRVKNIVITQKGRETVTKMRGIAEELNQKICSGLTDEDIEVLERYMVHLKSNTRDLLQD